MIFREDLEEIFGKRIWDKEGEIGTASEISKSYQEGKKAEADAAQTIEAARVAAESAVAPVVDVPAEPPAQT